MKDNSKTKTPNRGNAKAAQNRKVRRLALREELASREYLRQIEEIDEELQKDVWSESLAALRLRADLQFRRLAKTLPDLKAVNDPIDVGGLRGTLSAKGKKIVAAMIGGEISPDEGASLLQAIVLLTRITESDELAKRVSALEDKHGKS